LFLSAIARRVAMTQTKIVARERSGKRHHLGVAANQPKIIQSLALVPRIKFGGVV
jgi:hypothetical protein